MGKAMAPGYRGSRDRHRRLLPRSRPMPRKRPCVRVDVNVATSLSYVALRWTRNLALTRRPVRDRLGLRVPEDFLACPVRLSGHRAGNRMRESIMHRSMGLLA